MTAIKMILVAEIRVLNPRARNKAKFLEIVGNISKIGVKKPITVSVRAGGEPGDDLVCGQGRLEAYVALGQTEVPAIVVDVPREDRYIMSLVENIAPRAPKSLEFAREVQALRERGYTNAQIAEKVDVSEAHVSMMARLVKSGEECLLRVAGDDCKELSLGPLPPGRYAMKVTLPWSDLEPVSGNDAAPKSRVFETPLLVTP